MTRPEKRIEILKLVYRHDHPVTAAVDKAKVLEEYVFSDEVAPEISTQKPEMRSPGRPKKNAGNSDPLS